MGLQSLHLEVQNVLDVHEHVGGEVLRGRHLVVKNVAYVARRRDGRVGERAMILVGIVEVVDEDEARIYVPHSVLDEVYKRLVQG